MKHLLKIVSEKSLAMKITVSIVLAVTCISVLSLIIHLIISSKTNQYFFQQNLQQQEAYLKESLQLPLWDYNTESVKKIGQIMAANDLISFLAIKDNKDNIIFMNEQPGKFHDVVKKINIIYRDRNVGSFELRLTKWQYKKQQKKMMIVGLINILALISGIVFIVILSVQWFIKKPLFDFSLKINALANGEYDHDEISDQYLELRDVMNQFQRMTVKIENREKALVESNKALKIEIAEHQKTESLLRKSEKKYRSLNNNIPVGVFRIGINGEVLDYNACLMKILHIPDEKVISRLPGENFFQDPKDRQTLIDEIIKEKQVNGFECQLKNWDNQKIWVSISARGIEDNKGNTQYVDGVIEDITEKKTNEKQLIQFAKVIEQADEEVIITTIDGTIQYVNPSFEKNTGYAAEDVQGAKPSILKSGLHDPIFYKELWETILDKRIWKGTLKNKCSNGNILIHDTTITPILDATENIFAFVSIRRDITKQVEMEHQFLQAQKMQAIGTLAGGIAHDFNNILSGIFGYSQLAQSNINDSPKALGYLTKLVKASQRASELVQQILTFSRQAEYKVRPFSIYFEVNEALKLLRSSIPVTIEIKKNLVSRSMILADPTKIHQVVMNLCTNAYHAMRKTGGILSVSLNDKEFFESKLLQNKKRPPGKYLELEISDTGHGMNSKTLEKIFDPYFTTKKIGQGTGLGLSIVQAIVDEHDGFLEVFSLPGEGTRFFLYFQIVEKPIKNGNAKPGKKPSLKGTETIMLVDDEAAIRDTLKGILENYGYHILPFCDGREASEAFKSDPDKFGIIITDMTMPEKSGADLIQEIRSIKKDTPIILCSGFNESADEGKAFQMGANKYLMKPIMGQDLLEAVRKLLDEK